MLMKLTGGRIYDPANGVNGEVRDLYVRDGRIISPRDVDAVAEVSWDLSGQVVMAGAIDMHTHIGGGKVTIARIMFPEDHSDDLQAATALKRAGCGHAVPSTFTTGYRYAEMGYTACFEPAMLLANARQTHMELADTPIVDKGTYVLLGNDDYMLRLLSRKAPQEAIRDYMAWIIEASQSLAIKVVNPGGISAFKFNERQMDLDASHPHYGQSPRQILLALAQATQDIGLPHPLHVHGCNLGVPGNVRTTLDTIRALDGLPAHMTHIQFHSYGDEGDRKFSSGAALIAEAVNKNPNISVDVGQVLFNQTVTISGDNMHQYAAHKHADPKHRWTVMDIECDAGCGVVPFRYRDRNFVNALQWLIGLELFLLIDDPWRVFLTTDHPNGAPFTSYPHLIRLLMDRSFRNDMLLTLNKDARSASHLHSLNREYSLYEIAIMTRAGPARSLGLRDRGHLGPGAAADITVYTEMEDKERMFQCPTHVFKDGELVVRDGTIVQVVQGGTHTLRPEYDRSVERDLKRYYDDYMAVRMDSFKVRDEEILDEGRGRLLFEPCSGGA